MFSKDSRHYFDQINWTFFLVNYAKNPEWCGINLRWILFFTLNLSYIFLSGKFLTDLGLTALFLLYDLNSELSALSLAKLNFEKFNLIILVELLLITCINAPKPFEQNQEIISKVYSKTGKIVAKNSLKNCWSRF